jgi:hypothetical protein
MLDMTVLFVTALGVASLIGSIAWFLIRITEQDEKIQREQADLRAALAGGPKFGSRSLGGRELASTRATMPIEGSTRFEKQEVVSK